MVATIQRFEEAVWANVVVGNERYSVTLSLREAHVRSCTVVDTCVEVRNEETLVVHLDQFSEAVDRIRLAVCTIS